MDMEENSKWGREAEGGRGKGWWRGDEGEEEEERVEKKVGGRREGWLWKKTENGKGRLRGRKRRMDTEENRKWGREAGGGQGEG